MQFKQFSKILIFLAIFGVEVHSFADAFVSSSKTDLNLQSEKINFLMRISGLQDMLENNETSLKAPEGIDTAALEPGQVDFAQKMMLRAFSPNYFFQAMRKPFLKNFKPEYVEFLVRWYRTPLGRKILELEKDASSPESQPAIKLFVAKLLSNPPSEERIALIESIERATRATDLGKAFYLAYARLMHPFNKKNQGKEMGQLLRNLEGTINEPIRKIKLRLLLYSLKDLSQKEIRKYAAFVNSNAGRWFNQLAISGIKRGLKRNLHKAEIIQGKLIKEIQAGGPRYPLLKEIAPPGQRYFLIGKRDPFKPLVVSDGVISPAEVGQQTKVGQQTNVRHFGGELNDIPPIALMVLDKIEDQHPSLYRKLKHFERLFSDREGLKKMSDDEYEKALEKYRDSLEQSVYIEMDESPLQIGYDNLKMTGIIRKKMEAIAMFEIGTTGYAVREGDRIGPSFGYVDEIGDDQIKVVEKFRDYLGNILTSQKTIDFFQGTSSGENIGT